MTLSEALRALHAAGRIGQADPGEAAWAYLDGLVGDLEWFVRAADPMVVGCLLALLREASGDPRLHLVPGERWWSETTDHHDFPDGRMDGTEGEAIKAALVALAMEER